MSKRRWPATSSAPVCMHLYWGLVTLTGVDVEWISVAGRDVPLVEVHPDRLLEQGRRIAGLCNAAWIEHLTPLNALSRAMLAIARDR